MKNKAEKKRTDNNNNKNRPRETSEKTNGETKGRRRQAGRRGQEAITIKNDMNLITGRRQHGKGEGKGRGEKSTRK